MPNKNILVIGTRNFQPTPEQIQRVQTFLKWTGYDKQPDTVIFVPPKDFPATAHAFNAQTRTALTHAGRTYINAALLNGNGQGKENLEWTLAHELAHLNSPGVPAIQEKQDYIYDDEADDVIRRWNGKQGRGYRTVQSQINKLPGEFEPSRAPLGTDLTPPQSSAAPDSTPTPAPSSQPNGLLSLARIGAHVPFAVLGALGAVSRKV